MKLPALPTLSLARWIFFAITWLIFAAGIFGTFLFVALTETASASDVGFWFLAIGLLLTPPILVAIVSLVIFGATRRIKNTFGVFGCGVGLVFVTIMAASKPAMLHGARSIVYGTASGSPAKIGATDAAWVDVSPAFVDTTRVGYATYTTTDNEGRSSTRSRAVAPILTAHGEADAATVAAEPAALFICLDDREDVIEAAQNNHGTISGRMARADFLERQAMDDAKITNRVEAPRCVVPGSGASTFWVIVWILIILGGATGGAALVVSVASPGQSR